MFELADHLVGIFKTHNMTKSSVIKPREFSESEVIRPVVNGTVNGHNAERMDVDEINARNITNGNQISDNDVNNSMDEANDTLNESDTIDNSTGSD